MDDLFKFEKREIKKECKVKKRSGYHDGMYRHESGRFSGQAIYESYAVLDKNNRKIAECSSRIKAQMIVDALNNR